MLTTEIRQTYGRLPEDAKQAILALSLLVSRIRSLPDDDRKDLFELMREWQDAEPADRDDIQQTMEEILAQVPFSARVESLTTSSAPAVGEWPVRVGKLIRKLREERSWTQAQLADKADLPQSHISRLENAEHSATNKTIRKLAKALKVDISVFDPSHD